MKTLLLCTVFTVLLCTSALAAEKGIAVDSLTGTGVTLTAQTAAGDDVITEESAGDKTVYPNTERVKMVLDSTTSNTEYLVFVLTGENNTTPMDDNIVYIDQQTGTGSAMTFYLFPSSLSNGKYTICVATSDNQVAQVGSFEYYASYTLGDIDGNGKYAPKDARDILRISLGKGGPWTEVQRLAADVDGNGRVAPKDAREVLRASLGKYGDYLRPIGGK